MNFDFTDSENTFVDNMEALLKGFAEDRNLEECDLAEAEANLRQTLVQLAQIEYLQLATERAQTLVNPAFQMRIREMISQISPSLYLGIEASIGLCGQLISSCGSAAQKSAWLSPLLKGEKVGGVALSEESMNVENEPLKTTGLLEGDQVVVNGRKTFVVNGGVADLLAVAGTMDDDNVFFLLEKGTPGLKTGERIPTPGYQGAVISEIVCENCRIPKDQVLGPATGGNLLAQVRLWENLILVGASLGLMKGSLESAKSYAKEHKSGGKPVIAYQEVGFKLAEMLTLYQTSQLLAFRAAWDYEHGGHDDSLVLCAKVFCTEAAEKVASEALKILSGQGYRTGIPAERAFRCTKYGQIAGTSLEISRVKIGDTALGMR